MSLSSSPSSPAPMGALTRVGAVAYLSPIKAASRWSSAHREWFRLYRKTVSLLRVSGLAVFSSRLGTRDSKLKEYFHAVDDTTGGWGDGFYLGRLLARRARSALAGRERKRRQGRLRLRARSVGKWSGRALHDAAQMLGDGVARRRPRANHYRRPQIE